jgi:hypothetical protein
MALRPRDALQLLAHVGPHTRPKGAKKVRFLDAVVQQPDARALRLYRELPQRVAVQRGQQQVAHADVQLHGLQVRHALGRVRNRLFGDERGDQALAKIRQREALRVHFRGLRALRPDHEVDQGVVRVTAIDGERGDARAGDHREREETRADDVTKSLKASDALTNALEPPVGADRVEGDDEGRGHRRRSGKL